jgi:hypothetical protein
VSPSNARRIEAARVCEPAEDFRVRMARAWEGPSNSGTAKVTGSVVAEPRGSRLVAAVQRAFARDAAKHRPLREALTPQQRQEAADFYRTHAAELERQS